MDALNKKIASFYKLLANRNRFLNKEVQRLHFSGLRIMPLDYDPLLIVVKLSCKHSQFKTEQLRPGPSVISGSRTKWDEKVVSGKLH